jgi:hypothetical protein
VAVVLVCLATAGGMIAGGTYGSRLDRERRLAREREAAQVVDD